MSEFSAHTQWQAELYDEHPPLNPFEKLHREIGFALVCRPKDLATKNYLEQFKVNDQTKILDMGCASGFLLQRISKTFGSQGTGIDVSKVLIDKAKQEDPNNQYFLADASKLPFPDNTFDLVTSFDNLEHIQEYKKVIKEMVRVLKPGGTILLNTINKHNRFTFDWLLEKLGSDYHMRRAGHVKELFFDPQDIKVLFEEAGLENTKIRLFDATFILIMDCALYIFLMAIEKLANVTNSYHRLGRISLTITNIASKLSLPVLEKCDTVIIKHGFSNAFFLTGVKSK